MKMLFACCFLLSSSFLFASVELARCKGGEGSEVSDRWCVPGQWLVSLDKSEPFVAKLVKTHIHSVDQYYEIIPRDYVTYNQRRILGQYLIKIDQNDLPVVEKRFPKGFLYDLTDFEDSI